MKIMTAVTKHFYSFQNNNYMRRPEVFLIFVVTQKSITVALFLPNSPNPNCVVQYLESYFFPIFMSLLCPNSKWHWGKISHAKLLIWLYKDILSYFWKQIQTWESLETTKINNFKPHIRNSPRKNKLLKTAEWIIVWIFSIAKILAWNRCSSMIFSAQIELKHPSYAQSCWMRS